MILRYAIIVLFGLGLTLPSSGQLSYGGIPASFSLLKKAAYPEIQVIDMEPVDNYQLLIEEQSNPNNLKSFYFAKSFKVNISPEFSGQWEVKDDLKIWRLGLRSKGAWSLNLIFDKFIIPHGASLYIYSNDHSKVLGAFTSDNEQSSGYFSTYPIPGDEIIVEYNEPLKSIYPGELHISSVNHDYKNVFGTRPLGESGVCNMDVYCPDAVPYILEKQSVVNLIVAGRELCTGTLINNSRQDKTPYLLTAGHCIENASDAQKTIFCFNYESPACGNGESSMNGYADQTLSGAILKARSDSLDFALIQLETSPPAEYRPYFAGWNRSVVVPSSTFAIHHPKGDVKKVSKDNNPPTIGSYNSDFTKNSFWIIGKWEIGTTETGSSGCALFNQNKLLIGSLTGGTATCTDPTNDLFSMFNKQWDYYKTSDKQLKIWLDPGNTGATELAGLNPFDNSNSCSLFTNAEVGENYILQKVSNQFGGYKSGHNILKISGYAERFRKTDQTLLSSVSIGIAKVNSKVYNQNSKVSLKIYSEDVISGMPGNELVTMDLPFSLLSENKMNHIELESPVIIQKNFFIGFEINYSNLTDTFAVYHTPDRLKMNKNEAFVNSEGSWKPFYWIPELEISTSLLINANGCQNTLAVDNNPTVDVDRKFEVLYPQSGVTNYILLRNKGTEEYGAISLYDILGHKLFTEERLLSVTPKVVSLGHYRSGVYFLTVETVSAKQVIKIKVNNIK
ncbi:MAG: trypsin-like peptidase domain-containing protein [Bacteroidia bacterium]|nr:trypsin-like peptidase domain-containing protein [Bacteroidia bacterium]